MLSFFPRGVLDEILNLIESVSEDFPSYSCYTGTSGLDLLKAVMHVGSQAVFYGPVIFPLFLVD